MSDSKPFDKSFVLQVTTRNIHKDIDFSIRRTFERFKDFEPGSDKHKEVFDTLGVLHTMHQMIEDFEKHNEHLFNPETPNK